MGVCTSSSAQVEKLSAQIQTRFLPRNMPVYSFVQLGSDCDTNSWTARMSLSHSFAMSASKSMSSTCGSGVKTSGVGVGAGVGVGKGVGVGSGAGAALSRALRRRAASSRAWAASMRWAVSRPKFATPVSMTKPSP